MRDKTDKTLHRIQYVAKRFNKILVGFSGGKDSVVLYDLVKKAGVDVVFKYQNTTIDPPGTISFIRQNFPDVEIIHPELSFFKLVEKNGLPNRFQRWCCRVLKESNNAGFDVVFTGVRRAESSKRSKRKILEKYKNQYRFTPIIDWTEQEVWKYIKHNNLPMIKYYSSPYFFTRHGCVLCPLATKKQMVRNAKLFPKYVKALLNSVKVYRDTHKHLQFVQDYHDEYEMVYLFLTQQLNFYGRLQKDNLFGLTAKQILLDLIEEKDEQKH